MVTALEESAASPVYKLHPKQTEAVLAFVRGYDVSVSLLKVRVALKIRISNELGCARRDNSSGICLCLTFCLPLL